MSEVSSVEQSNEWAMQANEWVVRANERMDEQVAQYLHLESWLFWTIVERHVGPANTFNVSTMAADVVPLILAKAPGRQRAQLPIQINDEAIK